MQFVTELLISKSCTYLIRRRAPEGELRSHFSLFKFIFSQQNITDFESPSVSLSALTSQLHVVASRHYPESGLNYIAVHPWSEFEAASGRIQGALATAAGRGCKYRLRCRLKMPTKRHRSGASCVVQRARGRARGGSG